MASMRGRGHWEGLGEMTMRTSFWLAILLLAAAPAAAQERRESPWKGPPDPGPMVGELGRLVDKAGQDHSADPRFLKKLKTLVGRYSWHWSKLALSDDFGDGDFTKKPTWTVAAGEFWIDWNKSLRSRVTEHVTRPTPKPQAAPRPRQQTAQQPDHQSRTQNTTSQMIGSILEQVLGRNSSTDHESGTAREGAASQQTAPTQTQIAPAQPAAPQAVGAELSIKRAFSTGFDIRIEFVSHESKGRLEFSSFIGSPQGEGYRLAYVPGAKPKILLIRFSKKGSTVFYDYTYRKSLDDGKSHFLQWRRWASGATSVRLDGENVIKGGDATYRRPFDGFAITNLGGDFGIREIEVRGTP